MNPGVTALHQPLNRRTLTRAGALAALAPVAAGLQPGRALAQDEAAPDAPGEVTQARVDAALAQLPDLAATILAQSGVPGMAVAVVYGDTVVYSGGFGVRDVETGEAVNADTIFLLASVSKPLAATVVSAVV
ncbi:MAG: beta-lactamase family protein, partial [Chloroflexia bacterium]|nr:beta-lactamase family protein [Chloroflexia bacterium]